MTGGLGLAYKENSQSIEPQPSSWKKGKGLTKTQKLALLARIPLVNLQEARVRF